MPTIAQTLCAIERRAACALAQELRQMTRQIVDLRTHLTLEDRAHADGLLLKLDHLIRCQEVDAVKAVEPDTYLAPDLHLDLKPPQPPSAAYLVHLYSHEHGDLERVVLADDIAIAVQFVRDRLGDTERHRVQSVDCRLTEGVVTWLAEDGIVLASVEACEPVAACVDAQVAVACSAFIGGDASLMKVLFVPDLLAA